MNTKNNRRRRESREKIEGAFMERLQTCELTGITVSELCKATGLNRSTFYANYMDIYDLAGQVRERIEEEVRGLYCEDHEGGFSSGDFLKLFRHIRDHQLFYNTYFKLGYENDCRLLQYDAELARRHFGDKDVGYHVEFFRGGLNAILKLWLAGGCRETPEEIAEVIQSEYRGRV